ncbi:hypothetical protein I302_100818 [Kwoniella bestiolae CBS 10118]|uniref:WSC domain-containing protein n=1 Tax=Kwoniella bestiolae CBS 10118 TaxID=1296100 RepID=A0A1B9G645_9TREE|nr:hypothetical protein I302_04191 [Kwoniella bestiolae CBS 10118]OCF26505.1 hypothetical protein I302_04191 [Kwoniella bestiolae CBS 10118]
MFPIALAFLLAPIVAQAASFSGCMSSTIPHKSESGLQIVNVEGTDCIDQCTASGFEYSYSYYEETDSIHYCHCDSASSLDEHKDSLRPAYQGERCYEGDATVYHLSTELNFSHCAHSLSSSAEHAILGLLVDTPAQCFEHCSTSSGVYLLPPPTGIKGGQYECFCQQPEIQEAGVSSFCDSGAYRRFDAAVKSSRLVFQSAGNDIQKQKPLTSSS